MCAYVSVPTNMYKHPHTSKQSVKTGKRFDYTFLQKKKNVQMTYKLMRTVQATG